MKANYHNQKEIAREILQTVSARDAYKTSKNIRTTKDWEEDKERIMLEILCAKYQHNAEYRTRLHNTGSEVIHEDTMHPYWGGKGGKDRLGTLHMQVRENKGHFPKHLTNLHQHSTTNKNMETTHYPTNIPLTGAQGTEQITKKTKVLIMGDSNTKYLNPDKMTKKCQISIKKAMTTEETTQRLAELQPQNQIVIIHSGTNDLKEKTAEETANSLIRTT